MNFMIPNELKLFLEEDKLLSKKNIASGYGIHDLSFSKHLYNNTLTIPLPEIKHDTLFYFSISSCFLLFPDNEGDFGFKVQIKTKTKLRDHGVIFLGRFSNNKFEHSSPIGTQFVLNCPSEIVITLTYPKIVKAILNGGLTTVSAR